MIELRNISKQYGGVQVLKDVSFQIEKGKITSFIGANGAGKSTLLSIITRLVGMDQGQVLIEGRDIKDWKSRDLSKTISVLKQSNHINIRLTVEDLVAFGRFPYSQGRLTPEDEKYIQSAISYMNLEPLRKKYLDELSGGQRQRAYIAMVIAQDTDYILLDEPLNNLDMKHSVQIMKVLRRMVDELGKTIIIVIHDINFASCYSHYIAALKDGSLVRAGPADEIIDSDVLRDVYDMDIPVQMVGNRKFCVYFE